MLQNNELQIKLEGGRVSQPTSLGTVWWIVRTVV